MPEEGRYTEALRMDAKNGSACVMAEPLFY